MNTITVERRKPRNPLVGPALFRRAGAHRDQRRSERQRARQDLRAELKHVKTST